MLFKYRYLTISDLLGTLNRYFIQLISCGDDYQFQELIRIFLPVLIRSIEGQTEDFRKRVSLKLFISLMIHSVIRENFPKCLQIYDRILLLSNHFVFFSGFRSIYSC